MAASGGSHGTEEGRRATAGSSSGQVDTPSKKRRLNTSTEERVENGKPRMDGGRAKQGKDGRQDQSYQKFEPAGSGPGQAACTGQIQRFLTPRSPDAGAETRTRGPAAKAAIHKN